MFEFFDRKEIYFKNMNYSIWILGDLEIIHKMNLWNDYFIAIKEGQKTIEMRLNDDKSRKIQTGHIITTNLPIKKKAYLRWIDTINYFSLIYQKILKI